MSRLTLAQANQIIAAALAKSKQSGYQPMGIAVLIKDAAGQTLGAVGASGGSGDEDEAICVAGVEAAGLVCG